MNVKRGVAMSKDGGGESIRPTVGRGRRQRPLGLVKTWPRCLRSYAAMIDHKPTAEAIFWGTTPLVIYNEEYRRLFGGRVTSRRALSAGVTAGKFFEGMDRAHAEVLRTGDSFVEDKRLLVNWDGVEEEGYFTFRGSPLFDDQGAVAGIHQSVVDNTPHVHAARRSVPLTILSAARDATSAVAAFANAVRANPADIPFALLYDRDYRRAAADDASASGRDALSRVVSVGVDEAGADLAAFQAFADQVLTSDWPLLVQDVDARLTSSDPGPGARRARKVVALPLRRSASERAGGAVVFGVSRAVRLDESYVAFFEAIAERLTDLCSKEDREATGRSGRALAEDARKLDELGSRARDEFLAVLGRELRNPLSPMRAAAQLMKIQDPIAFRREREIIERQIGHLASLLDDLRDVSQLSRGKVELHRHPVELRSVLDEAAAIARPLVERGRHTLEMRVPEHGLVVDGDRARLRQIFANLVVNAAKYTPGGGRIDVEAERTRETIAVTVRDNGPGVPEDLASRLFEPFTQGKATLARSGGGLGLGLAIVKNFVTLHGGTVTARTPANGQGSEFVVVLPAPALSSKGGAKVAEERRCGSRILVMDPDEDAAEWLARLLQALGHTTALASDGACALDRAHDFLPHVALLAVDVFSVEGVELARRFRGDPHLAGVRLVAVTDREAGPDASRARRIVYDELVAKPIDVARLSRVVGERGESAAARTADSPVQD